MGQLLIIATGLQQRATGGVTMHVHRLLKTLIEPYVLNYNICDYKKESFFCQLKKIRKANVLHMHVSNPCLKLFYVIACHALGTKSIITVHGKYGIYKPFMNFIHKTALKWCDMPVLINKESYDAVSLFNEKAVYIPAFLPPIIEEEKLDPEMEQNIREIKKEGKTLFVTNASNRSFTEDKKEIYGIDFLIEYFRKHKEYNLVILDPNSSYKETIERIKPDNVWLYTGQHSFCGLIQLSDVVIRNTCTDGDSFSVKEALYLHKPILCTDVVSRPEGVSLFHYNDEESLNRGILEVISVKKEINLIGESAMALYREMYSGLGIEIQH